MRPRRKYGKGMSTHWLLYRQSLEEIGARFFLTCCRKNRNLERRGNTKKNKGWIQFVLILPYSIAKFEDIWTQNLKQMQNIFLQIYGPISITLRIRSDKRLVNEEVIAVNGVLVENEGKMEHESTQSSTLDLRATRKITMLMELKHQRKS